MLSKWPIRVKLLVGLALLLLLVIILSSSGLYATYAYRNLAKSLSRRAIELPKAVELSRQVGDLRITLGRLRGPRESPFLSADGEMPLPVLRLRDVFRTGLDEVEQTLSNYRDLLERKMRADLRIADTQRERETVAQIEAALAGVRAVNHDEDWMLVDGNFYELDTELERLQSLSEELPSYLHDKLLGFADEVRNQYRMLIVGTWLVAASVGFIFALFVKLFYRWIFRPLRVLIDGSREVARGRFGHRIHLETDDEMAELARAMNGMTERFQTIRDDLDRQVRERTRQVVRSEQLASVGFLAAGVAHEINNPLASIALCAESLEDRVCELLEDDDPQHAVIGKYLKMIQTEAFRCKEITEKLLDFSRTGQVKRQSAELGELVGDVMEMVGHLGRYQQMHVELRAEGPVIAPVNPQQIKQVVLNLLTNALDCLQEGGTVCITLTAEEGFANLTFVDDGCGMEPGVLEHVFEPFFTRRRAGQGTGLGLSITYRIISDHGGDIEAQSAGPGRGATFRVRLPLADEPKEVEDQYRAA